MKKRTWLGIGIFLFSMNLLAQKNDGIKTCIAQIALGYPIGSHGMNSFEYTNLFSLNILYGLNGGVNGAEIGSILNYDRGNVTGFQLSGVLNINRESSSGLLLSGVSNICKGSAEGVFISGVLNCSKEKTEGLQLAAVNISANELEGLQLGIVNVAKKLKGVQLGAVNVLNDGDTGLPIGLVSVVKNGLQEFELTGGDAIYSNLNYKIGVEKFYTIYKMGFSTFKDNPVYSLGFGLGKRHTISERQNINFDISSNNIMYNNSWNGHLNMLNKIDFNYKFNVTDNFSLIVGPSLNVYISKEKVDGTFGTLNLPYTIYSYNWEKGKMSMWAGFNAGLSIKL